MWLSDHHRHYDDRRYSYIIISHITGETSIHNGKSTLHLLSSASYTENWRRIPGHRVIYCPKVYHYCNVRSPTVKPWWLFGDSSPLCVQGFSVSKESHVNRVKICLPTFFLKFDISGTTSIAKRNKWKYKNKVFHFIKKMQACVLRTFKRKYHACETLTYVHLVMWAQKR